MEKINDSRVAKESIATDIFQYRGWTWPVAIYYNCVNDGLVVTSTEISEIIRKTEAAMIYSIGGLASFWLMERIIAF